jgi:hypothetical protein
VAVEVGAEEAVAEGGAGVRVEVAGGRTQSTDLVSMTFHPPTIPDRPPPWKSKKSID